MKKKQPDLKKTKKEIKRAWQRLKYSVRKLKNEIKRSWKDK